MVLWRTVVVGSPVMACEVAPPQPAGPHGKRVASAHARPVLTVCVTEDAKMLGCWVPLDESRLPPSLKKYITRDNYYNVLLAVKLALCHIPSSSTAESRHPVKHHANPRGKTLRHVACFLSRAILAFSSPLCLPPNRSVYRLMDMHSVIMLSTCYRDPCSLTWFYIFFKL